MQEIWVQSWVGKIPWRRKWQPTPVFLPRKSQGQRSLVGYSPWGHKESGTADSTDISPDYRNTKNCLEQTPRPRVLCSLRMRNQDWIFQLNLPNLNNVFHYPSLTTEGKMSFPISQRLTHRHPASAISLPSTAWSPSFLLWEKTHGVWWGARSRFGAFRKLFNSQKRENRGFQ